MLYARGSKLAENRARFVRAADGSLCFLRTEKRFAPPRTDFALSASPSLRPCEQLPCTRVFRPSCPLHDRHLLGRTYTQLFESTPNVSPPAKLARAASSAAGTRSSRGRGRKGRVRSPFRPPFFPGRGTAILLRKMRLPFLAWRQAALALRAPLTDHVHRPVCRSQDRFGRYSRGRSATSGGDGHVA